MESTKEIIDIVSKKDRKQYIWVEKYRPKNLSEYLGNESIKEVFSTYIKKQDINNICFSGNCGVGKSSISKILVKEISCDSLYINASDENGIDTIRDKIKSFASSCGFKPLKILILDECDGLTPAAQASLRPVMEIYSLHTRFILCCNYLERLIDPILSRVQVFEIYPPSKKDVALHLINILKQENVTFSNEDLAIIVNTYYPDIRKIIQFAQQSSMDGVIKISKSNLIQYDVKNKIVDLLKNRASFLEIRKYINDQQIYRFEEIYDYLYEKVDEFANNKQCPVILHIADGVKNDSSVKNKQIVFLACIIEILKILKG